MMLDYSMLSAPFMSERGIELVTSGEITAPGQRTPFGPAKTGMFNTRIDHLTPQLGPVMHTTCDMSSGSLFCVGDLFPTLRDMFPNRAVVFMFSTYKAPAVVVRPPEQGGIRFQLLGLIDVAIVGAT
ncbi:unnamed protein product, partial [Heligmosomoides polygyrus]